MEDNIIDFTIDENKYKMTINDFLQQTKVKIYLNVGTDNYAYEYNGFDFDSFKKILIKNIDDHNVRITYNHSIIEMGFNDQKEILSFTKILFYIYILELDDTKYYVGKSSKPMKRISDHLPSGSTRGSGWTQMYKPVKILEIKEAYDPMEEDFTTLRYMNQKGIDNVRGGSFCELNLSPENLHTLEKIVRGADDKCYYCGSVEHLINNCDRKNTHRKTTKSIEKKIPKKEIVKSKIMKHYGAEQLLNNSDKKLLNVMKDQNNPDKIKCKYCKMPFQSTKKMKFHSEYQCPLNKKNQLIANVDKILEENSKYI